MNSEVSSKRSKDFEGISENVKDNEKLECFHSDSTVLLSSGHRMPVVGLGTSLITGEETIEATLAAAIEVGYRKFDTAFVYQNENVIGSTLKKLIESGRIKREEIFIVGKLPYNGMKSESVEHFCKKSIASLQLGYIDLYLIHSPVATKRTDNDNEVVSLKDGHVQLENVDLIETWHAMESLVHKGHVRSIGLSNFNSKQIQRIYDAALIKPANLQVECHAYLPQYELFNVCKQLNISMTAYSPLGCPHFAEFAREKMGLDYNAPKLLEEEKVKNLERTYGKSSAQILLRYLVQRGIAVIPRSTNPNRIRENYEILNFSLNPEDMSLMRSLENGFRYIKLDYWKGMEAHPEYPFHIPF